MIPHLIHPAQVHEGLVRAGASTAGGSAEHYIPVGAGGGKIWKGSGVTWNAFVEPQWTVSHDGDGVPKLQVFTGLNMQFPLRSDVFAAFGRGTRAVPH